MQSIHLTKEACLPVMQKAFREQKIQAFTRRGYNGICTYSGPCVIGVCLTRPQRKQLDGCDPTGIGELIKAGIVTTDDDDFFRMAQSLHDRCLASEADRTFLARHLGVTP